MFCGKDLSSVLIILSSSLQFGFITNYNGNAFNEMKNKWDLSMVPDIEISMFSHISNVTAGLSGLLFIFIFTHFRSNTRFWFFVFLRSLQGVCLGCYAMIAPVYIMEFSNERSSGFNGSLIQVAIGLGGIITSLVFYIVNWQIFVIIPGALAIIFAGVTWLVPESAYIPRKSLHDNVFKKEYRFHLFSIIMLMVFQQVTGINIVCRNIPGMMSSIGLNVSPYLQTSIVSISGALASFIAAFIMETIGRKWLWVVSCVGLIIGIAFYVSTLQTEKDSWLSALGVFIYNLFFGFGMGPIPWFICAEVFPESVRYDVSGINTFVNMIFSFAVGVIYPMLVEEISEFGALLFFAGLSFLAIVFAIFCMPEKEKYEGDSMTLI